MHLLLPTGTRHPCSTTRPCTALPVRTDVPALRAPAHVPLTLLGSGAGPGPCAQLPASSPSVSRSQQLRCWLVSAPPEPSSPAAPCAECAQTPWSRAQAGCDSAGLGEFQPRQDPGPRASPASTAAAPAHPLCLSRFAPRRHTERASSQGECRTGASCSQLSRTHFCDSPPVTAGYGHTSPATSHL